MTTACSHSANSAQINEKKRERASESLRADGREEFCETPRRLLHWQTQRPDTSAPTKVRCFAFLWLSSAFCLCDIDRVHTHRRARTTQVTGQQQVVDRNKCSRAVMCRKCIVVACVHKLCWGYCVIGSAKTTSSASSSASSASSLLCVDFAFANVLAPVRWELPVASG